MRRAPGTWAVYFAVEDCDMAVERVRSLGGQLHVGPVDIEPGRFAVAADVQEAVFQGIHLHDPDD